MSNLVIAGSLRVLGLQALVMSSFTIGFLGIHGFSVDSKSALVGGLTALLPSCFYVWRSSRVKTQDPRNLVKAHYRAESGKLAITAGFFALAFTQLGSIAALPLFVTYVATLASYWVALLLKN
ncbi:ATP synthase subunit I [Burkholderiales bacterium]|nr:ATP synthase subunit I [Burkholderiales bacterium]